MQIGVTQLRANLSECLDRVKAGEDLVITERGVPVARVTAIEGRSRYEELVAQGVITPARKPKQPFPRDWEPIVPKGSVTELLLEQRGQRW